MRDGPEVQFPTGHETSKLTQPSRRLVIKCRLSQGGASLPQAPALPRQDGRAPLSALYQCHQVVLSVPVLLGPGTGIHGRVSTPGPPCTSLPQPSPAARASRPLPWAKAPLPQHPCSRTRVDIVLGTWRRCLEFPTEDLKRMCPSSVLKRWSLDPSSGCLHRVHLPQFVDSSQQLCQPGRITLLASTPPAPAWTDTAIKSGLQVAKNIQAAVDKEITER